MSLQQHLNNAIKTGNAAMVERLIVKGVDIDHGFGMQGPPLCAAITASQPEVVRLLIDAKCNLNVQDYDGESPLCLALRKGFVDIAKMLILGGCRVNREDPVSLKPPIVIATEKELVDIVQLLVSNPDCDVNKKDKTGSAALHHSVSQKNMDIARLLVKSGRCRVNVCNQTTGENALHVACKLGYLDCVQLLLSTAQEDFKKDIFEQQQQQKLTAHKQQQMLCENSVQFQNNNSGDGKHQSLEERLSYLQISDPHTVCDVNRGTHFGEGPLHFACIHDHTDIVKLLIDAGSDVNVKDPSNKCPLHHAVKNENLDIVELLLSAGAGLNDVAWYGQGPQYRFWKTSSAAEKGTPLHLAVASGNIALVRRLVESGADLTILNQDGQSPVMLSMVKCRGSQGVDIVEYLLNVAVSQGVDVSNMKDLQGCTLPHLVSHIKDINPEKLVHLLVQCGCDLDEPRNEGMRPIHSAIDQSNYNAVKALLDCGCSVNAAIAESSFELQRLSPLHLSAMNGQVAIAKLLISYGADIDAHFHTTEEDDSSDLDSDSEVDDHIVHNDHEDNNDLIADAQSHEKHQDGSALTLALEDMNSDLARLLLSAGMDLARERYLFTDDASLLEEKYEILNLDPELKCWILSHLNDPPSLRVSCRQTIRAHFTQHNLKFHTELLPLPAKLKNYLTIFPVETND